MFARLRRWVRYVRALNDLYAAQEGGADSPEAYDNLREQARRRATQ